MMPRLVYRERTRLREPRWKSKACDWKKQTIYRHVWRWLLLLLVM